MNKNKIIAVIGYANVDHLEPKSQIKIKELSHQVGKILVDDGFIIANGGLGGIMEMVSEGAKYSNRYDGKSIMGILPNYDKNIANTYIDFALPIGFDMGRNIALISIADAVVIIGGGAGTLNEVSLAWQLNKLIIAVGNFGWAGKLRNTCIDNRREDKIYGADCAKDVVDILHSYLGDYTKPFQSINNIMSQEQAKQLINEYCGVISENLNFLGKGSESFVFCDNAFVYKVFKPHKFLPALYFNLSSIAYKLQQCNAEFHYRFSVLYKDNNLIISYPYAENKSFTKASKKQFQDMLLEYYQNQIVHLDIQPKNLRMTEDNKLFICDIGIDLFHFTDDFFESMCRRAFGIYKLQDSIGSIKRIKDFLTPLNTCEDFTAIEYFLHSSSISNEYKAFREAIVPPPLHLHV